MQKRPKNALKSQFSCIIFSTPSYKSQSHWSARWNIWKWKVYSVSWYIRLIENHHKWSQYIFPFQWHAPNEKSRMHDFFSIFSIFAFFFYIFVLILVLIPKMNNRNGDFTKAKHVSFQKSIKRPSRINF